MPGGGAGNKRGAFGVTETDAGSDASGARTRAELQDGEWVVNGAKQFITNSGTDITAGVTNTTITARSEAARGEISAHMVPQGAPGYTVEMSYRKLGWHSADTNPPTFQACRVLKCFILRQHCRDYRQYRPVLVRG